METPYERKAVQQLLFVHHEYLVITDSTFETMTPKDAIKSAALIYSKCFLFRLNRIQKVKFQTTTSH